jgi:cell division protein FtsL
MNRSVVILILALMASSLMLVYSQQRSRMLYAEKNRLEVKQARLNQEWSRLELLPTSPFILCNENWSCEKSKLIF